MGKCESDVYASMALANPTDAPQMASGPVHSGLPFRSGYVQQGRFDRTKLDAEKPKDNQVDPVPATCVAVEDACRSGVTKSFCFAVLLPQGHPWRAAIVPGAVAGFRLPAFSEAEPDCRREWAIVSTTQPALCRPLPKAPWGQVSITTG